MREIPIATKHDAYPCVHKMCWKHNNMIAVFIARDPETLLFMPIEEAARWIHDNYDGKLPDCTAIVPSKRDMRVEPKYSIRANERGVSYKDKKYYIELAVTGSARRKSATRIQLGDVPEDVYLAYIATEAMRQTTFKN